jgi:hypothetical protein
MNWDAIGAIGEITGAVAVVSTLIILIFQIRQSTKATLDSNQLDRAAAIDRHSDSVARWRGRITENEDLSRIWLKGRNDEQLTEIELLRINNLWIEFTNTQRSNFVRAETVGEKGLAKQAVLAVAAEARTSQTFRDLWAGIIPWLEVSSPKFVKMVQDRLDLLDKEADTIYSSVPLMRQQVKKS